MDRRDFTAGLPVLLGMAGLREASAQAAKPVDLPVLSSGVFKPGPEKPPTNGRASRAYVLGLLKAGNLRLEMHETTQQPGATHEPVGHHLHNEIWCVQRGVASLYINGTEHRMEAGDTGLVCAGDEHWIKNIGDGELQYFVITVGPPE